MKLTEDEPKDEHVYFEISGPSPHDFEGFVLANLFKIPNDLEDFEGRLDVPDDLHEKSRVVSVDVTKLENRASCAVYLFGPTYAEDELPIMMEMMGFEQDYAFHFIEETEPKVGVLLWDDEIGYVEQLPEFDESRFEVIEE